MTHHVYITGSTGYLGSRLIPLLAARGHAVRALVRETSRARLPAEAEAVVGDALVAASFTATVAPCDTLVHLVGTPHPSPRKAAEFERVDLASLRAALAAAGAAGSVRHVVYVSVARPAPVMRAYLAARAAGEERLRTNGLPATVLRPWYVLGPGHRWPYLLLPVYALARLVPAAREGATRLGLVTLRQMLGALVAAVESPMLAGTRIVDVPGIRASGGRLSARRLQPRGGRVLVG